MIFNIIFKVKIDKCYYLHAKKKYKAKTLWQTSHILAQFV